MFRIRYPAAVADSLTTPSHRPGVAWMVAVCWVAMTALLPLALEQRSAANPMTEVLAVLDADVSVAADTAPSGARFAALSGALQWPFGLVPTRAIAAEAHGLDDQRSAPPALAMQLDKRRPASLLAMATRVGSVFGFKHPAHFSQRLPARIQTSLCQRGRIGAAAAG